MERDETRRTVDTVKGDTHDALDEMKERVKAGGESVKRAVAGDEMSLGDRIGSHAKELGHELRADVDKSKRQARDEEV